MPRIGVKTMLKRIALATMAATLLMSILIVLVMNIIKAESQPVARSLSGGVKVIIANLKESRK